MMRVPPELAGQPDRLRWNARYAGGFEASFHPHPLAERALSLPLPAGFTVLDRRERPDDQRGTRRRLLARRSAL